jgi:Ca2+-binding EF-hand superfamily protein
VLFAELTPKEAIDLFDTNSNGMVDMNDARVVLKRLCPSLSETQVHHILEAVPFGDGGAAIPIERCLLYLHLKYGHFRPPVDDFLVEAIPKLMAEWSGSKLETDHEVVSFGEKLFQDFHRIDEDKNGFLSKGEILRYLYRVVPMTQLGFNAQRDEAFFNYLDVSRTRTVNIFELYHAVATASGSLRAANQKSMLLPSELREDMFSSFNALVSSYRTVFLSACRATDVQCRGDVPRQQLMAVMQAVLKALPHTIEVGPFDAQLDALCSVLPEAVRYEDLFTAFEIIDGFQR